LTALLFLLGALVISAIGSAIIVFRHRKPRRTEDWSIEEFRQEMRLLSPEAQLARRMPSGRTPRTVHPVRPTGSPGPADEAGDRGR
jgi:hypothetical protein